MIKGEQSLITPGNRLKKLSKAMDNALDGIGRDCSFEKFVTAFPQLGRDNPNLLHLARNQTIESLQRQAREVFDQQVASRNLESLLFQLDEIILDAQLNPVMPIQLTPERIMLAHRYNQKKELQSNLQSQLAALKESNATLSVQVQEKRVKMTQSLQEIDSLKENLFPSL